MMDLGFTYQYDGDGNLERHTRPDGSLIDYEYNARNLLAKLDGNSPPPVASYTSNGRNRRVGSRISCSGVMPRFRRWSDFF